MIAIRQRLAQAVKMAGLPMAAAVSLTQGVTALAEEPVVLEEVTVTARFRDENLQDVPASIRAFSGDDLDRLGVSSLGDLTRFTPSLNVQERGPNRNELNIRGITNFLTTQDLLPSARPVGVYLDEAPINTLGGAQVEVRNFDLQRVEVLRGPQGTLYGEGSSAGALRYFTHDPELGVLGGKFEVEGIYVPDGDEDFGVRAAVNIPLLGDTAALRLSGGRYVMPGYIDSGDGKEDSNDYEALNIRGVFLARPTERLNIRLMANYDDSEQGSLGLVTGDIEDLEANLPTGNDQIDDESLIASAKIDYELDGLTLSSITGYFDRERRRDTYDQVFSLVNSFVTLPFFGYPDQSFAQDGLDYEQWSQELRLVSQFEGPLQFTAGVFYRDFTYENIVPDVSSATFPLVGLPGDSYSEIFTALGIPVQEPSLTNDGEQISAYLELDYALSERWSLTAGVRYHTEEIEVFAPANPVILSLAPLVLPEVREKVEIDAVLPKLAVQYAPTDDLMFFAQYASGARNGNLNSTATLAVMELFVPGSSEGLESYDDDKTGAWEIGLKSTFWDGRATFNATAFYTDYEDLQVIVATPPLGFGVLVNASEASSTGFEAEFTAQVSERLNVFVGGNYADAQLEEDLLFNQLTGEVLPSGTDLPNSPDYSVSAGAEYVAPAFGNTSWYINGTWSYTGEYTASLSTDASTLGDFSVLNAGLGLRGDTWSADLLVTNLADESQVVARNDFNDTLENQGIALPPGVTFDEIFVLPPRTIRLAFRYTF